ncbi:cation diffusion facilitator family transporter [Mesobacterium sp. TK19101]|uniref:Cation diffusion facilitator family transporter n=2 Tax=Mesobacterium hydrothermale TaxID=3111907 RepID=A0ABU6HBP4_9RHOB|nr:cation diffusion facilitator family transporter [Mesobacterium sp. TK19101]MEC3859878.1 cation diffusion facilitator family transporter [Mesobacterium sp. TK19101]
MTKRMQLAVGSLIVGLAVLALKASAWWVTGSVALLSDALESTVNLATAVAALIAVRVAAMPADANHPYGHHKAEFFSAVLEGVMIVIAALLILREAAGTILDPQPVAEPLNGLLINGGATVLNALWGWILITRGRALRSPALAADGKHLMADVVTSVGVAIGILLALTTGWWLLDPLMAIIVAIHILWSGFKVIRDSLSGLLDEAVPAETLQTIRDVISTEAGGAVEAHDLRTRHAGRVTFIDFHLVVPGETTVSASHAICDRIETALKSAIPDANITIHVEPEDKAKHTGIVVLD